MLLTQSFKNMNHLKAGFTFRVMYYIIKVTLNPFYMKTSLKQIRKSQEYFSFCSYN